LFTQIHKQNRDKNGYYCLKRLKTEAVGALGRGRHGPYLLCQPGSCIACADDASERSECIRWTHCHPEPDLFRYGQHTQALSSYSRSPSNFHQDRLCSHQGKYSDNRLICSVITRSMPAFLSALCIFPDYWLPSALLARLANSIQRLGFAISH
jgi:hypothetical protein